MTKWYTFSNAYLSVIILEGLVGVDRISNHRTGKRRIKDKKYSIYKKNIKNRK